MDSPVRCGGLQATMHTLVVRTHWNYPTHLENFGGEKESGMDGQGRCQ